MRFASLGSGSRGNATLIEDEETCLLIDLGFTLKETEKRLRRLSKEGADISAILVTHEHADHIHGVAAFARKYQTPIYLSAGTLRGSKLDGLANIHQINCHKTFEINSVQVEPVPVPHDAREPCQYLFSSCGQRLGVLTDLGHVTTYVKEQYANCDVLLLEFNHDVEMLSNGPYPYSLKQRVGGSLGHLNNDQAAELLSDVDLQRLQHLVVSHISEKNNSTELALNAITPVIEPSSAQVHLATQKEGLDWLDLC